MVLVFAGVFENGKGLSMHRHEIHKSNAVYGSIEISLRLLRRKVE